MDLNNLFIARKDAELLLRKAEEEGFPRSTCSWIKGIYAVIKEERIKRVVVVTGGDCSNAVALAEVLAAEGVEVTKFAYPEVPDRAALLREMEHLAAAFGTSVAAAEGVFGDLEKGRALLRELDRLTWERCSVTGRENYDWHLRACDFGGAPELFEKEVDAFLTEARARPPRQVKLRLGLAGVPPIHDDLFEFLKPFGADILYNETPRQFALGGGGADLPDAYCRYTYPYGVERRVADIKAEVIKRKLAGIVHYVQTFCYRGIQDILVRRGVGVPVLTLEGDRPGPLTAQQRLRIETFLEMLSA